MGGGGGGGCPPHPLNIALPSPGPVESLFDCNTKKNLIRFVCDVHNSFSHKSEKVTPNKLMPA